MYYKTRQLNIQIFVYYLICSCFKSNVLIDLKLRILNLDWPQVIVFIANIFFCHAPKLLFGEIFQFTNLTLSAPIPIEEKKLT